MPVMLNPPSFPTPPAAAAAAAAVENQGDGAPAETGFAQALLAASRPARGERPSGEADSAADDETKIAVDTYADAAAIVPAWPIPLLMESERVGARFAIAGERRDGAPNGGDVAAVPRTGAMPAADATSAGDPEMRRTQIAALPDAIASAREASRTIAPENRKAAPEPDSLLAGLEPATDDATRSRGELALMARGEPAVPARSAPIVASTPTGAAPRAVPDTLAAAAAPARGDQPARGDPPADGARSAQRFLDAREPNPAPANPVSGTGPAPESAIGAARTPEGATSWIASPQSQPAANDAPITALLAPLASHAPPPEQIAVAAPVASAQWTGEIAGKLAQVIVMRQNHVEIRLNPPQLGPVDVQVHMTADQATVLIAAPHAVTRDALEQALPQLREALAQQGITLGQATVQGEAQSREAPTPRPPHGAESDPRTPPAIRDAPAGAPRTDRLIDTFA